MRAPSLDDRVVPFVYHPVLTTSVGPPCSPNAGGMQLFGMFTTKCRAGRGGREFPTRQYRIWALRGAGLASQLPRPPWTRPSDPGPGAEKSSSLPRISARTTQATAATTRACLWLVRHVLVVPATSAVSRWTTLTGEAGPHSGFIGHRHGRATALIGNAGRSLGLGQGRRCRSVSEAVGGQDVVAGIPGGYRGGAGGAAYLRRCEVRRCLTARPDDQRKGGQDNAAQRRGGRREHRGQRPADATDRIEPTEPIDRIEPAEPTDRIEPLDPMLRMEPEDPSERDESGEFRIATFWQAGGSTSRSAHLVSASERTIRGAA
jgi:hypothetical protein